MTPQIAMMGAFVGAVLLVVARFAFRRKRQSVIQVSGGATIQAATDNNKGRWERFYESNVELLVTIIISLLVLMFAFYIIVKFRSDKEITNWAFGMVGLIVGYWINNKSSKESNMQLRNHD